MFTRPISCLFLLLSPFAFLLLGAEKPARLDRYGDPLPEQALARLGTVRFRCNTSVYSLAYSPDGKLLAAGDIGIILWDVHSGRKVRDCQGPDGQTFQLAFSPDGKLLVSASGNVVVGNQTFGDLVITNVATGKLVFHLDKTIQKTQAVAFSPDSKTIASGHAGARGVCLWDAQTGKLIRVLGDDEVIRLAFAPDGKRLAVVERDETIRLWDLPTGKLLPGDVKPPHKFSTLAFSKDGTVLAAAGDDGIQLYQASSLKKIPGKPADSLTFVPTGKTLVTTGKEGRIRVWDVGSGKQRCQLPIRCSWSNDVSLSPNGQTVASVRGFSGVIRLWDVQTGAEKQLRDGHDGGIDQIAFLHDEQSVLSTGRYASKRLIWPKGTGQEARPVELPTEASSFRLCPDRSTIAITTKEGTLLLYDLASKKELVRCPIDKKSWVVAVSADNKLAAVKDFEENLQVWDLAARKEIQRFGPDAWRLEFAPDGRRVAVKLRDHWAVWDLETKRELCRWEEQGVLESGVAFSPDGRTLAIATCDEFFGRSILLWEIATGLERLRLKGHEGSIGSVAFSPDGRLLASGSWDNTVRLWNVATGKEKQVFSGHFAEVKAVAFSADGQRLVSGSDDTTALIWPIPAACLEVPARLSLGREELNTLWDQLADTCAIRAYAAQQRLAAARSDAVALCRTRLFEAPKNTPEKIAGWIAQLDAEKFTVREQALRNLERAGGEAEHALETTLKGHCSEEVRLRINGLLETVKRDPVRNRRLRAVELLEQIGTPEAVDVLRQLEKKTGDAAVRDDVRRSLGRLAAKQKAP